jgi:hypothetical protein
MPIPIHAKIVGTDTCAAEGITAVNNAPVLELCRKLIAAGCDPKRPLQAYRGSTLCLTVSSIAWGARTAVEESNIFGPRLARYKPFPGKAAMRQGRR